MSNWDDEDFQPAIAPVAVPKVVDKWEGEDEEDEIKESWEDFGDEDKKPESGDQAAAKANAEKKKKKKLADIVAEKERKKLEELERKKLQQEPEPEDRPLTEAERIALEEERELEIAKETFGVEKEASASSWDLPLKSDEDLKTFRETLVSKLEKQTAPLSSYVAFLEDFLRDICVPLDSDEVKKLSSTVNAILNEKVNAAKASKAKKGKKSGRANLNVGSKNAQDEDAFYGTAYDDYDDFI